MDFIQEVLPGVLLVDVHHFGEPGLGGAYILTGEEAALVDSGTSLAKERILQALDEVGIAREKVRWILLTHVHLDHAGGAGVLLPELPEAKVVVHRRGARHLADPSRLLESTRTVVGERFKHYGVAVPVPLNRIYVPEDGEVLRFGRYEIQVVDAPGHAPHHLCFLWEGALFTGDAAGLYLHGRLLPTTVPPSFDLEASLSTLDRLKALKPRKLLYAHFGPGEPELLSQYQSLLRSWVETVGRYKDRPAAEAVEAVMAEVEREGFPVGPGVSGDWAMSIRGVLEYLQGRASSPR